MTFCEFMRAKFGADWVLAPRLTPRLAAKGYTAAVSRAAYDAAHLAWARACADANPDILIAARVLRDYTAREAAEVLAKQPE